MSKIFLANDHGAFDLKVKIKTFIEINFENYTVIDLGTKNEDSVDYPEYGKIAGEEVTKTPNSLAIVCCGSGIGISIAANKVKGIRCALCNSVELSKLARQHNGANVLALGARTKGIDNSLDIVEAFLSTPVDQDERHQRRRCQLDSI